MSKRDDARLNQNNPLYLRATMNGGGTPLSSRQVDENSLNLMRLESGGTWTARVYLKNEVVIHRGGSWIALVDVTATDEPGADYAKWFPLSGIMGRNSNDISAPVIGADIGITFQDIPLLDVEILTPVGSTYSSSTGDFSFTFPGLWMMLFSFSIEHNSSNQGRTTNLRLFNTTDGVAGEDFPLGIGRNQEDTAFSYSGLFPIPIADIGDTYRVQIGGGSSITSVTWNALQLEFVQLHYG